MRGFMNHSNEGKIKKRKRKELEKRREDVIENEWVLLFDLIFFSLFVCLILLDLLT